jgi:hypothetical protein
MASQFPEDFIPSIMPTEKEDRQTIVVYEKEICPDELEVE